MGYTGYELAWLFFAYSFLGWVLETIVSDIKNRKLVNRGLVNSPLCVIYGSAAVAISVGLQELNGISLFVISAVIATVIEWIGGHLIENMYHERWWDYSDIKGNLDGYICIPMSVFWGILGWAGKTWGNNILLLVFRFIPETAGIVIVWVLIVALAIDLLASMSILKGRAKLQERLETADQWFSGISFTLTKWICKQVDRRIQKAYPTAVKKQVVKEKSTVFAEGCSFYKIFLLFVIGAFLGDITETIYCRITAGYWMSRSSLVWGPFSIVWGLAIALVTWLLYKYKDYSDRFLFITGALLGGTYEYLCSVFTEIVFGKVFWDYSWMPFNLGGRINLLYCFFWGLAGVVWFKMLYPRISKLIEKIPMLVGKIGTWVLVLFMCTNVVVSCMALIRYDERGKNIEASSEWKMKIDEAFPDEIMKKIYPNAMKVE